VGRIIMAKAAEHLTPVALELGSKCPCIVDWLDGKRDSQGPYASLLFDDSIQFCYRTTPHCLYCVGYCSQVAVNRITAAKWGTCAGQACIAIDYLLVEEEFAPILVRAHEYIYT
jgi:aldehyde dehydrogenase (NAD+)